MICFNEENHSYVNDKGDNYISVSQALGMFQPPFDEDHWSSFKALQEVLPNFYSYRKGFDSRDPELITYCLDHVDVDEFNQVKKAILEKWKNTNRKAINKGNRYHKSKEKQSILNGTEVNPFTGTEHTVYRRIHMDGCDNYSLTKNLYDLEDGYYPELLLWNDEYGIAGQSDRVFIETGYLLGKKKIRYVDIDDYKTNKKITMENAYENLLPPLDHHPHSKFHYYQLQISFYAWMLEQKGFTVRNLSFTHYNKKYPLKYLRKDIYAVLDYLKNL